MPQGPRHRGPPLMTPVAFSRFAVHRQHTYSAGGCTPGTRMQGTRGTMPANRASIQARETQGASRARHLLHVRVSGNVPSNLYSLGPLEVRLRVRSRMWQGETSEQARASWSAWGYG